MGASGFKRATVYKASDPTDYIELRALTQDSRYEKRDITAEDLDGDVVVLEEEAVLQLGFYDESDVAKLKAWKAAGEKMNVVVVGLQDYIFWDRNSTFKFDESAVGQPRRRNVRRIEFRGRGSDLAVERRIEIQLWDDETKIAGFIAGDETDDGVMAIPINPASIGDESSFTWTIDGTDYTMDTVILNTR